MHRLKKISLMFKTIIQQLQQQQRIHQQQKQMHSQSTHKTVRKTINNLTKMSRPSQPKKTLPLPKLVTLIKKILKKKIQMMNNK